MSKRLNKRVNRRAFLKMFGAGGAAAAFAATAGYTSLVPPSIAQQLGIGNSLLSQRNAITRRDLSHERCTSIIVGPGATKDGSVLHSHNNDVEPFDDANWIVYPHNSSPTQFTTSKGLVIPMSYFASLNIPGLNTSEWNSYMTFGLPTPGVQGGSSGFNEKQVCLSSNEDWTCEPSSSTPIDPVAGATVKKMRNIEGMTLSLANTAWQGVQLIGKLTENYGAGTELQMVLLSDPTEGWIIETTPLHWAAVKVPKDGYLKRANSLRINTTDDALNPFNPSLASPDAESYALANNLNGFDMSTPFSWMDCYTDMEARDNNNPRDCEREARVDYFLQPKLGQIQPEDLMQICRDHFEGTYLYHGSTTNPLNYPIGQPGSPHWENPSRTICCAQESSSPTSHSFVAHQRSWVPNPFGLMWVCQGPPCAGIYLPYWVGASFIPTAAQAIGTTCSGSNCGLPDDNSPTSYNGWAQPLPQAWPTPDTDTGDIYSLNVGPGLDYVPSDATHPLPNGYYDSTSAWWVAHRLLDAIDDNYPALHPKLRFVLDAFEMKGRRDLVSVENKAFALYNSGNTAAALSELTSFMELTLQQGFNLLCTQADWAEAQTNSHWP